MSDDKSGLTSRSNVEQSTSGFPSPAADYLEKTLDLHRLLVEHPAATFFMRAAGDGMREAGIFSGDLLIVDRSLPPEDGRIVVAIQDGRLQLKRLEKRDGHFCFMSEVSEDFTCPETDNAADFAEQSIWGVVTRTIHTV